MVLGTGTGEGSEHVLAVAEETGAIPYDIPGVDLGHVGELCSFDAFLAKYGLDDPALCQLAVIIRGADTSRLDLTPQSPEAVPSGLRTMVSRPSSWMAWRTMVVLPAPA